MSTVEEIVEAIKELSPEEREEVRRQLISLWSINLRELSGGDYKSLHLYLQEWQKHSKSPNLAIRRARPRRPPIEIKGKPISETVIEDRR